jgi:hypothetical protein
MDIKTDCIEPLGNDQYKCTKHGFIISTTNLPIRCGICSVPAIFPPPKTNMRVSKEEYEQRLEICNQDKCGCLHISDKTGRAECAACLCDLAERAWWHGKKCPEELWADDSKSV